MYNPVLKNCAKKKIKNNNGIFMHCNLKHFSICFQLMFNNWMFKKKKISSPNSNAKHS